MRVADVSYIAIIQMEAGIGIRNGEYLDKGIAKELFLQFFSLSPFLFIPRVLLKIIIFLVRGIQLEKRI